MLEKIMRRFNSVTRHSNQALVISKRNLSSEFFLASLCMMGCGAVPYFLSSALSEYNKLRNGNAVLYRTFLRGHELHDINFNTAKLMNEQAQKLYTQYTAMYSLRSCDELADLLRCHLKFKHMELSELADPNAVNEKSFLLTDPVDMISAKAALSVFRKKYTKTDNLLEGESAEKFYKP